MQPQLVLNIPAVLVAALAAFFFGWIWYGPLFGKTWAKAMGMKMDKKPDPSVMMRGMVLQIISLLLMSYVLAHSVQVWRPSVWNAGQDQANHVYGLMGGFFTWLGFFVPMQLHKVAWENKSWKLFLINIGHDFIALQILGQILAAWR
jgi:hypothetical protein